MKKFKKNNKTRELMFPLIKKYLKKQGYIDVITVAKATNQTREWTRSAFVIFEKENKNVIKIHSSLVSIDYILKNGKLGGKYDD